MLRESAYANADTCDAVGHTLHANARTMATTGYARASNQFHYFSRVCIGESRSVAREDTRTTTPRSGPLSLVGSSDGICFVRGLYNPADSLASLGK